MEFLLNLLDNSTTPWLTALLLGLMTAISPCPMATNISAIGFISRDIESRHRVFINGLLYTTGRAATYASIALVIFLGADQLKLSGFFQRYGEKIIGPLLIIIGLFMLDLIKIAFPVTGGLNSRIREKTKWGYLDALLLGMLFALAFCPYSGVLYFGMLVPLTVSSASGLYLPLVYAFGTGIPAIVFAWVIAYTISEVGTLYNKLKIFELWFRRIIALLFIAIGIYYLFRVYIIF